MSTRRFFKGGWTYDTDSRRTFRRDVVSIPWRSVLPPLDLFDASGSYWGASCPPRLRRDGFPAARSCWVGRGRRLVKAPGRRGRFQVTRIAPPKNPYETGVFQYEEIPVARSRWGW